MNPWLAWETVISKRISLNDLSKDFVLDFNFPANRKMSVHEDVDILITKNYQERVVFVKRPIKVMTKLYNWLFSYDYY